MHAPPPFQITVRHFGVWRWGCGVLVAAAGLTTAAWSTRAWPAHAGWFVFTVSLLVASAIGLLVHAWRLAPTSLRWDGQVWQFGPAVTIGQEPQAGRLSVAMDLGSWMLLSFVADGARSGRWLPLQRRGHEPCWPALRATVYCARPVFQPTSAPF
ncbi:MAG: hypothetical protein ABW190_02635 [Rhizobacter sp.]